MNRAGNDNRPSEEGGGREIMRKCATRKEEEGRATKGAGLRRRKWFLLQYTPRKWTGTFSNRWTTLDSATVTEENGNGAGQGVPKTLAVCIAVFFWGLAARSFFPELSPLPSIHSVRGVFLSDRTYPSSSCFNLGPHSRFAARGGPTDRSVTSTRSSLHT